MKKNFILASLFIFLFSGCFSVSSINPFSDDEKQVKEQHTIEIPDDAPKWLQENSIKNNVVAIGIIKKVKKENFKFLKKQALINAGNNLTRKIYIKTLNIYKQYEDSLDNPKTYDKDKKRLAEHISLKSLKDAKIKNSWIDSNNTLYVQVSVDAQIVAQQIQASSKKLFEINKNLYQHFLSNRALEKIITYLETNIDN